MRMIAQYHASADSPPCSIGIGRLYNPDPLWRQACEQVLAEDAPAFLEINGVVGLSAPEPHAGSQTKAMITAGWRKCAA
jgi:hypothetical protein